MVKKKSDSDSFENWAKGRKKSTGGRPCEICHNEVLKEEVRLFLRYIIKNGAANSPSYADFHRTRMRIDKGYKGSLSSMKGHIKEHETTLWDKAYGSEEKKGAKKPERVGRRAAKRSRP